MKSLQFPAEDFIQIVGKMTATNIRQNAFAEKLIEKGLSIIPINKDKTPAISSWKQHQAVLPRAGQYTFNDCQGLICGKISGNIEAVDIDAKYDPSLVERYQNQIDLFCPELIARLTIQKTPSGGLHLIYRCSVIEGNKKLASRSTTDQERSINQHERTKVLIETRGEGGYIAIAPTPGYSLLNGSFEDIQEITPEERELLLTAARSLNEVYDTVKINAPSKSGVSIGASVSLTPWDDFNQRGDVPGLLHSYGWMRSGSDGQREYFRRPGKSQGHSASYNPELKLFYCFTSSTQLEPSKAYPPAALYALFECNGDFTEAAKRLYAQGYGERSKSQISTAIISRHDGEAHTKANQNCILFRPTKPTSMERPKKLFGAVWAQGELAFLFAEDGAGKSILAVQIGVAIATGQSIPGFQNEVQSQAVTLIDAELSDYQFNTRFPEGLPEKFKRFTFSEDQQGALVSASIQFVVAQIEQAANSCDSKIIILDNVSALTAMIDCTKTSDSIQLMGLLNELKKRGFSLLVIDHCRKTMKEGDFKTISKQDLQGSKMKSNLSDSVFSIGKSCQGENIRYIKALKIRSYEMAYTKNSVATMALNASPLRLDFLGMNAEWEHVNDRNSEVMKMSSGGATQKEIAEKFKLSQQAISKILND
jgi:hypothetical protein